MSSVPFEDLYCLISGWIYTVLFQVNKANTLFFLPSPPAKVGHEQTKKDDTYLVWSHSLVADLSVDGTFNDARHQLGNVFVVFFLTGNLLHCE